MKTFLKKIVGKEHRRRNITLLLLVVILVFIFVMREKGTLKQLEEEEEAIGVRIIREAAVAGQFYPDNNDVLEAMIEDYLSGAEKKVSGVKGLVVPHAGYIYSGAVAGWAYKSLEGESYDTIILLGPTHNIRFIGASIPEVTHYRTPFGLVEVSPKIGELLEEEIFVSLPEAHLSEHSVEVQIPFLQKILTNFQIIPVVVGEANPEELADALLKVVDDRTLVVASSDLSHYYPYKDAQDLDAVCNKAIPSLDFESMNLCEACGKLPILTLMYLAKNLGWSGELLDYRNSGDTAGSKDAVVGYTSIAFYKEVVKA